MLPAPLLQDLKADEDEMLRGVDWGAVQRYVDLSGELQMFSTRGGSGSGGGGSGDSTNVQQHGGQEGGGGAAEGRPPLRRRYWQQSEQPSALEEDLFEGAGWEAPGSPRSSVSGRQAEALADMGCAAAALLPVLS